MNSHPKAFTVSDTGIMLALETDCTVRSFSNLRKEGKDRSVVCQVRALWDTGAMRTVISNRLAWEMGLTKTGHAEVFTAAGCVPAYTYAIDLALPGDIRFFEWPVCSGDLPPGVEVLIGMDIMSYGDFAFSHPEGHTRFTFQLPSTHATDYVTELMVNDR